MNLPDNLHFKPDPWQVEFLQTEGDKILCCGRQVGKSEICSMDAAEWACTKNDTGKQRNILMIAPTERQAYALFSKTLNYLMEYKRTWISKKAKEKPTKERIILNNNTHIYCLPTGIAGTGIRFLTVHRLYVDECSRIPEEVWSAVDPMLLTTGGSQIYLSTPYGAVNRFYETWVNKNQAYDSFTRFSITSEKVIRDREINEFWSEFQQEKALEKIEQAKARMSTREFAQEYLGEFIEELSRYFTDRIIAKAATIGKNNPHLTTTTKGKYYLGVDIARMGEDKSSFQVLKKANDRLIHVFSEQTAKTRTTDTIERIMELDRKYNFKKIYIDAGSGSLGVGIFDFLLKESQTKRKVVAINNRARVYDREGKSKAKLLKEDLFDNLRMLMEQGRISLLDNEEVIESLRGVQYEYVKSPNQLTRLRIFSPDHSTSDLVEALVRAAWAIKEKDINIYFTSIRV